MEYEPDWLQFAVPFENAKPTKCQRFGLHAQPRPITPTRANNASCAANLFNRTNIVDCELNGFVYKTDEVSIVNEVKF